MNSVKALVMAVMLGGCGGEAFTSEVRDPDTETEPTTSAATSSTSATTSSTATGAKPDAADARSPVPASCDGPKDAAFQVAIGVKCPIGRPYTMYVCNYESPSDPPCSQPDMRQANIWCCI